MAFVQAARAHRQQHASSHEVAQRSSWADANCFPSLAGAEPTSQAWERGLVWGQAWLLRCLGSGRRPPALVWFENNLTIKSWRIGEKGQVTTRSRQAQGLPPFPFGTGSLPGIEKVCKAESKQVFPVHGFHGLIYLQNPGER